MYDIIVFGILCKESVITLGYKLICTEFHTHLHGGRLVSRKLHPKATFSPVSLWSVSDETSKCVHLTAFLCDPT